MLLPSYALYPPALLMVGWLKGPTEGRGQLNVNTSLIDGWDRRVEREHNIVGSY